jgi:uncharacterized protein (DUF1330 family)
MPSAFVMQRAAPTGASRFVQQYRESAMYRLVTPGLAMLAGVAIGAFAVQGLHAQAKAPVYYVAEIDVSNPDAYAKEFAPKAQAMIKAAGGRFLAVGMGPKVTAFDGDPPKRLVLQVWDSMDKINAWRNDPDYKALRKIGDQYATFRSFAVEGLPE